MKHRMEIIRKGWEKASITGAFESAKTIKDPFQDIFQYENWDMEIKKETETSNLTSYISF